MVRKRSTTTIRRSGRRLRLLLLKLSLNIVIMLSVHNLCTNFISRSSKRKSGVVSSSFRELESIVA
eukprot:scaffold39046_cov228-Skeletonema_dohrnii-CCMP3373.AAC.2